MKKIRRITSWMFPNFIFAYFLYLGLFENLDWAKNISEFLMWLNFAITMLLVIGTSNERLKLQKKNKDLSVPFIIHLFYDISISCFLVSFGWWFYGILNIVASLFSWLYFLKEVDSIE